MILTITANVAIDRTYVVDRLEVGAVHKVLRTYAQTGGKGVNVSRGIQSLGAETLVTGLLGRAGIDQATSDLTAAGLSSELFAVAGPARQTVTVTAQDGSTTAFDEPGPTVTSQEWADFEAHVATLLTGVELVVIAGSLPPGAPDEALEHLCMHASRKGVPAIVDARGPALRAALSRAPLVAKLNRHELTQTVNRELTSEEDVVQGALELRGAGAQHVVVTLGEQGAIGVGGDVWRVTHPAAGGNPIGAGDAFSAALALALIQSTSFEQALKEGAAAALASLRVPTAGALDPADMRALLATVQVDRILPAVVR